MKRGVIVVIAQIMLLFCRSGEVDRWLMMVKFRQPSHEFTFGVYMSFILYPLVLTPLV
jgi:hypothetical protein